MSTEGPDWGEMFGRTRTTVTRPRPRHWPQAAVQETVLSREQQFEKDHAEFVADLVRQRRFDLLDDVDNARRAFRHWKTERRQRSAGYRTPLY